MIKVDSSGDITFHLVLEIKSEFKTYSVKIDKNTVDNIAEADFDFTTLNYVDITKDIKKGKNKEPALFTCLFNHISDIPSEVIESAGISREMLKDSSEKDSEGKKRRKIALKLDKIIEEFKQFRYEKTVIKTIKYKAEVVKVKEDHAKSCNIVCKVLVEEVDRKVEERSHRLRYSKYRHLDLSNLKHICLESAELTSMPKWMNECTNLKKLELRSNKIKTIKKDELQPSLTFLSVYFNGLESIDISGLKDL